MKKNLFKLFLCVLALVTVISAFAVVASAGDVTETKGTCTVTYTDDTKTTVKSVAGGKIYMMNSAAAKVSSAGNLWQWNYHDFGATDSSVYTTKKDPDALKSLYGDTRTEYGLSYDLSEDGTLRIYAVDDAAETKAKNNTNAWKIWGFPNGLMEYLQRTDTTYEGGWFKRTQVKKIVIEADITAITEQSLNAFSNCTEIIMPASVVRLDGSAFSRTNYLKSVKVAGADYTGYNSEYVVDLRNITSYSANALSETFHGVGEIYPVQILINDTLGTKGNRSFSNASSKNSYEDALSAKSAVGAISVYTTTGESCKWIEDIADRDSTWTSGRVSYYTVNVYKLGATTAVSQLGYQVRTKDYNGLRAAFNFSAPEGLKVVENGQVLDTPEKITGSAGDIVEYGVIVAKAELADQMKLTKSGDEYVTGNEKIKKVVAEESKVDKDGNFFVTVVRFNGEAQFGTKICYVGYEIHSDGSVVYAPRLAPASLYDATLGSFSAGLINSSVGDAKIFWDVLNPFKTDMNDVIYEIDGTTLKCADYLKNPKMLNSSNAAVGGTGTDNTASFLFKTTADGDLYWDETDATRATLISFFESDGSYTAIAHLTDEAYAAYKADPTKLGTVKSGSKQKNWVQENLLSKNYIQIAFKSFIFDDGIGTIDTALKGLGTYAPTTAYHYEDDSPASINYGGELETVIFPQSLKNLAGGQSFHSDYNLTTVYMFGSAEKAAACVVDLSKIDCIKPTADVTSGSGYLENYFNRCTAMTTVKLPELGEFKCMIGKSAFAQCPNIAVIYVGDKNVTNSGTVDFTGTGYNYKCDQPATDYTKAFENVPNVTKVINDDGTVNTRTSGNTWTVTPAA